MRKKLDRNTWLYLFTWRLWCFLNFALCPGYHISEIYNYEGPGKTAYLSLEFTMAYNELYKAEVKVGPFAYLRGLWAAAGNREDEPWME